MRPGMLSALLLLLGAVDVQAQNIVQNPGFTTDLSSWTILPGPNYTVAWDGAMENSAPGSASVDLTSSSGFTDLFFLKQCAPATGSTTYDVGGSFRYPGGVATTPIGGLVVSFFSDAACTAPLGGSSGFGLSSLSSPADTWLTTNHAGGLTTPAGTGAVLVYLRFTTTEAGPASGWFDDIRITPVISCDTPLVVVPDGRPTHSVIQPGATLWFGASLRASAGPGEGSSYTVEFANTAGTVPPGTLTLFSGDDGCGGSSTLPWAETSGIDPTGTGGMVRAGFTTSENTQPFFRARLSNGSASAIPFRFAWSDTTMFSPAWSTNGSFDTFYSFQNSTAVGIDAWLMLLDTTGTVLSTFLTEIPGGQTLSMSTASLGVARNHTGTARLAHYGPPGAIVAEAAIANFSISPAYVQPVKFQAVREATH